jgi:N-terminal domain of toast_rack, DUF2154/Domain of unknown function (DUF5668)
MPQDAQRQKTSLVMPILLITIGALFLFRSWNPGFEPYQVLKTYWPLLLILVGLGKIWDFSRNRSIAGGQSTPAIALGSTLGVVAFVFVIVILLGHYQRTRRHNDDSRESFARHASQVVEMRDLQGAKSVSATLHMGAGQLNVSGGSAHLMNADFHFDRKWDTPTVDYHVSEEKGFLDVSQQSDRVNFGPSDNTWDLSFNDDVPMDLRVDMAAGQGNLKLRGMDVSNVELHMGAGQVVLDLTGPRKSDLNVSVKGGVGQATIRLPNSVGVIAHAAGGIGSIRTEGLHKQDGEYLNDSYGKTPHKITLDVQGGVGEIELLAE